MDALLQDNAEGVFQRHELFVRLATMPATRNPRMFWELSFVDKLGKNRN
jgi:hypothetical protein